MGINEFIQIGSRIRAERVRQGYSQKEFAEKVGIAYSTYSNYENNNREPKYETLKKIAYALNVPVDKLWLTTTKEMTENDAENLITLAGYNIYSMDDGCYCISNDDFTKEVILSEKELREFTMQIADYIDFALNKLLRDC